MHLNLFRSKFGDTGLSVILAIQVCVIFLVAPLSTNAVLTDEFTELLRFGLAVVAILIVTETRISAGVIGLAFVGTLAGFLLRTEETRTPFVMMVSMGVSTAFDIVVSITVAYAAFGPGRVTIHRILGAVILYLYIALIFSTVYRIAEMRLHPSFSGLTVGGRSHFGELLYFSLGALTTAGSGHIDPLHPLIRSLAMLEAVIGQLFPPTLLARLVTLHSTQNDS